MLYVEKSGKKPAVTEKYKNTTIRSRNVIAEEKENHFHSDTQP